MLDLCMIVTLYSPLSLVWYSLAGFSKDAMKLVQTYKNEERYLPSPETKAIVGAKFQYVLL